MPSSDSVRFLFDVRLFDRCEYFAGFFGRHDVEVPPLFSDGGEARLGHDSPQQQPVFEFSGGDAALVDKSLFVGRAGLVSEIVESGPHRKGLSGAIHQGQVNGGSEVVHARSVVRIGHEIAHFGPFDHIPHLLLNR